MRSELSLLRNMWPVVFLGAALVSGCESVDAAPRGPSGTGAPGTVESALEEGGLPNLVVSALESPTVVPQGSFTTFQVKVCNQGSAPAEGRVRFSLLPTPEVSSGSGIGLGETSVGELAPGQCVTREQPMSTSQPEGGHYLVAAVDADGLVAELSEEDNTRAHRLWIGQQAELVVTSLEAPPHVRPGEEIPVWVTVCNQGTSRANASAGLYLSSDASISTAEDTFLFHTMPVELEGGSCTTWEGPVWNPAAQGQHFLGAVADSMGFQEEADEENNTLGGRPLGVGYGPDLVVSAVTAPVSTQSYTPFTSSVTVCNQGTERAGGFFRLYLSRDAELSPWEEVYGGGTSVGDLEPGQCATQDVQVSAEDGMGSAWYVGARVESWGWSPELLEDNNTRLSGPMGVGSLPDFIVSGLTVPASSVSPWADFTTTVTVCNQGTQAGDTELELSLVSGPDERTLRFLEGFYLGQLEAGACVSRDVTVSLRSEELAQGPLYLRARTDPEEHGHELLEDNNTRLSGALTLWSY